MAVTITRGTTDEALEQFRAALARYQNDHPDAAIDLYRHGRYSIRVRVTDPSFAGLRLGERHRRVWPVLANNLSEETLSDISSLVCVTPEERATSFASLEFDDPVRPVL